MEAGLGRQFGWAALGRIVATALNLVALIFLSRLLGPAEFGRFALAQAVVITVDSVMFYWLVGSIVRMSPDQGPGLAEFRGAILIGYAAAGAATSAFGIACIAVGTGLEVSGIGPLGAATVAAVLGEALFARGLEHLRAFSRTGPYAFCLFLRGALSLGLAVVGLLYVDARAEVALAGHAAGCLVAAAVAELAWPEAVRFDAGWRARLGAIWRYGYPLSVSLVFRMLIQRLDRFVIGGVLGAEAAGLYSLAFDFARRALALPLMAISIVTYPAMVRAWSADDKAATRALGELNWFGLLLIGVPSACGLALVAADALRLLFGAAYAAMPGPVVASVAALCMLVEAIRLHHLDLGFMLRQDNRAQILINGAGFLGNAVGCVILIPILGPVGAAGVALATMIGLALLSFRLGRRALAMPTPLRPVPGILVAGGAMAGAVWAFGAAAGPAELLLRIVLGVGLYFALMIGLDLAGCRRMLERVIRPGTATP